MIILKKCQKFLSVFQLFIKWKNEKKFVLKKTVYKNENKFVGKGRLKLPANCILIEES